MCYRGGLYAVMTASPPPAVRGWDGHLEEGEPPGDRQPHRAMGIVGTLCPWMQTGRASWQKALWGLRRPLWGLRRPLGISERPLGSQEAVATLQALGEAVLSGWLLPHPNAPGSRQRSRTAAPEALLGLVHITQPQMSALPLLTHAGCCSHPRCCDNGASSYQEVRPRVRTAPGSVGRGN